MDRSILYNIEPIGIGTPYVESLSSYITRLADAHCVLTGGIISRIYAPYLGKEYLSKTSIRGGGFYDTAIGINGVGKLAKEFSQLTNKFTGRSDISELTLEKWEAILPTRCLLKKTKSWCPQCYEEAKFKNEVIYDPLIWNFQLVEYCQKHVIPLANECPHCKNSIPVIDRGSSAGFCSKCGTWLGFITSHDDNSEDIKEFSTNASYSMIGDLLATTNIDISNISVLESLTYYVKEFFNQTPSKAAMFFNIPKSTFRTWLSGQAKPNISYLYQMSKMLGISIIDFLQKEQPTIHKGQTESIVNTRERYDHHEIKEILRKFIENKDPVSISEVARIIGCDRKLLTRMHKKECNEIKKNRDTYLQKNKEERLFAKTNQLNEAFYSLTRQGVYPSRRRIEEVLGTGFLKEKVLQNYWNELKKEMSV